MKRPHAAVIAATIPLLLTSLRLSAGELPFKAPTTELAKVSAPLLHRTARYNLTSDEETTVGTAGSATEHLTMLSVRGNRIIESRELTSSPAELASTAPTKLHWSAAIGTGHTARSNTDITSSSHGVPASPHWSASIGTGAAATSTTAARDAKQLSSLDTQPVVATAHWTSRIGTGHAFDSGSRTMYASLTHTVK